ncbi:cation:dicarboxylate symporter family transporter [Pseudoduganella sp. S-14]|uniref:cation:dicarboxylate symporter family transporter n=1 Tax=Pseudoduganella sp. S-14 TaxID=3404065 RepID=UPI003CF80BD9
MKALHAILHQPAALLAAMLLGAWCGLAWPAASPLFAALAALYLSLVQAATLPFLALAVYFGLQRSVAGGAPWGRLAWLLAAGLAGMLACALAGALLTSAAAGGAGMAPDQAAALGRLTARAEIGAPISLRGDAPPAAMPAAPDLVPANLYAALAAGAVPSVLVGVILFGAAVAAQKVERAAQLGSILEAVYRGLEGVIGLVNTGLPLIAFVLAAAAVGAAGTEISLLGGFLGSWAVAALLASGLALAALCWRLKSAPAPVLTALRMPLTVCLFSPVGTAALPEFIEALSVRLGFPRGTVELLASAFPVFARSGEALFHAVLAVYAANIYGHALALQDLVLLALLSCWFTLATSGLPGAKAALWSGVLQARFGLPLDALLPVLVAVEVLCEGTRSLVSYLAAAALVALSAEPGRLPAATARDSVQGASVVLVLGRRQAVLSLLLLGGTLLLVFCAGLGAGLRKHLLATF